MCACAAIVEANSSRRAAKVRPEQEFHATPPKAAHQEIAAENSDHDAQPLTNRTPECHRVSVPIAIPAQMEEAGGYDEAGCRRQAEAEPGGGSMPCA